MSAEPDPHPEQLRRVGAFRRSGPRHVNGKRHAFHVATTSDRGHGVFASRAIAPGEDVLRFAGHILHRSDIEDFTHCLEIDVGLFLGPSGGADDFVNHSCSPNCAIIVEAGLAVLRAIKTIPRGAELTYDYSTLMVSDPTSFHCSCGSPRCRGRVEAFTSLPPLTRSDYVERGLVPGFVVRCLPGNGD